MNSESGILTRYAPGSVREIWTLSWPMILSAAASNLLIFGDRVVLSYYSADAFNANVAATPWCWAFVFVFIAYTGVAEVFVGRYNGARQYWKIGPVVWQMVFFSFALYAVLFPITWRLTKYMIAEKLADPGVQYLNISLLGLPIGVAAWGALASFFVGLGKTKIVFVITVICNIVNIILDVIFVFGWKFIPSYGCVGAAYATFVTQIVTFAIFLAVFLQQKYAKKYHTNKWKFDFHYIKKCLTIGTPHATSAFFNCFAAAIFWQFVAGYVSADDFTGFG
ncbi:MAG: hypothetical protein EOM76_12880, partial [Sphingobacteriia bacterium]|nr:hypothetical protein [Sphingobacteriia bacterium]